MIKSFSKEDAVGQIGQFLVFRIQDRVSVSSDDPLTSYVQYRTLYLATEVFYRRLSGLTHLKHQSVCTVDINGFKLLKGYQCGLASQLIDFAQKHSVVHAVHES